MIYPMRRFGLNAAERSLAWLGNLFAITMILFGVVTIIMHIWFPEHWIDVGDFWGGVLLLLTMATGFLLGLGSGGVRQNRPALDTSLAFMFIAGGGWIARGIAHGEWGEIITGIVLLLQLILCWIIRREGIRSRYKPRFFSLRQFETMVQIADVMLDDDERTLTPIQVAIRTDHFMAEIDSPAKSQIRLVLILVEWLLPFLIFRPFPFSDLGTHERRRVVEKVIWSRGLFRDVARTLKLLSSFSYYTDERTRRRIGYIDYDDRARSQGVDKSPRIYPLPVDIMEEKQ